MTARPFSNGGPMGSSLVVQIVPDEAAGVGQRHPEQRPKRISFLGYPVGPRSSGDRFWLLEEQAALVTDVGASAVWKAPPAPPTEELRDRGGRRRYLNEVRSSLETF